MDKPVRSPQTVLPGGQRLEPLIDGVVIHQTVTHQDHRGTLAEIYSQAWKFDDLPLVEAYLVTVRPGRVKGWALHMNQVDRYFFVNGTLKLVLYDNREGSPTRGMINERVFSELNRCLVSVPPGVYHAVENLGTADALMINLPGSPYVHADPDKYTLPLENDLIPYRFDLRAGY